MFWLGFLCGVLLTVIVGGILVSLFYKPYTF